ncbi:unnamed protein product [Candidula unifasciata]|uniref:Uncharacterized protein n=1 Tax=Candidula unifasciata TaxID=100452 RepID=A0A8S4A403_9EUPU|nr:unnamed protein product [Candidula unifasciata]
MAEIVSRLTKSAHNRHVDTAESNKTHNNNQLQPTLPPGTPSTCSKSTHSHLPEHMGDNRKLTDRELQRALRRIQKPTQSYLLSKNYDRNEKEHISPTPCMSTRPFTSYERKKAFQHLRRPTTASRGKHATECYLCLDDERELNKTPAPFEYYYADDKTVTKEEVECIVTRLVAPPGGMSTCSRLSPDYSRLIAQSVRLPLVSGLARSKSVADIVNRLYTSKGERGEKNYHGYSIPRTQITN